MIINCQCDVVNGLEPDQTASYNQFEPGLNHSISVTKKGIDLGRGCFVEFFHAT